MIVNVKKDKKTGAYLIRLILLLIGGIFVGQKTTAQPCKQVIGYYPNRQCYDRNK